MNKVILIGRLTRDPEVRYGQGPDTSIYARYTLAVDRRIRTDNGSQSADLYAAVSDKIPYYVGVYVPDGLNYWGTWYNLKCVKKAKRQDRKRPVSEMLLMMFRSAEREMYRKDEER